MPIPSTIDDLSTTASSNGPAGSETPTDGDGYLRAHAGFIAELRDKLDGTGNTGTIKNATFSGTMAGAATWSGLQTFAGGISVSDYASGSYTPTGTNVTNLTSNTPGEAHYIRMGSVVSVSGQVTATPTSGGSTVLGLSLPVASNFDSVNNLSGSFVIEGSGTDVPLEVAANIANDRVHIRWTTAGAGGGRSVRYTYHYKIT